MCRFFAAEPPYYGVYLGLSGYLSPIFQALGQLPHLALPLQHAQEVLRSRRGGLGRQPGGPLGPGWVNQQKMWKTYINGLV